MKRFLFFCCTFILSNHFFISYAYADCVILLHGLARSADSMQKLETELNNANYKVVNIDYPSQTADVETLANEAIPRGLQQCAKNEKINFVTHSMGGILVRQYLNQHEIKQLNKVVMLGPPNKGSEVVDKIGNWKFFKWLNGPAGQQLGTDKNSIPNKLGKANFDLGIIAGSSSINLFLSSLIPGEDDGKVSIENTKIDGMNNHLTMPVTHPFMMKNKKVIKQVNYYLQYGKFLKEESL